MSSLPPPDPFALGAASPAAAAGLSLAEAETAVPGSLPIQPLPTGKSFALGQNFPNPFRAQTTVPFVLSTASDVRLALFDPLGRRVAGIVYRGMAAGPQQIDLNLHGLGLRAGAYRYELHVSNRFGTYHQQRVMTAET